MRPIPNDSQDGGETADDRRRRRERQGETDRQEAHLLRREERQTKRDKERVKLDDDELWIAVQEF